MIIQPQKDKNGNIISNYQWCKTMIELEDANYKKYESIKDENVAYTRLVDEDTYKFCKYVASAKSEAEGQIRFSNNLRENSAFAKYAEKQLK